MKLLDIKKIDIAKHDRVTFIRVEPDNLRETLKDILKTLSDLSWINKFDEEYVRDSFNERAKPTIDDIHKKILSDTDDKITSEAGEYVVSELSREVIIKEMNYLDIPLAELYNKKKSGNPGFDFHSQNDCNTIIFGEAKYVQGKNAYGSGLGQVVQFIKDKKDIKDLNDLRDFFEPLALANVHDGIKGFAVGFSAKKTASDMLIKNLIQNEDYKKLRRYKEIVLVAVNL